MLQIPERDKIRLNRLVDEFSKPILIHSFGVNPHPNLSITPEEFFHGICERIYHEGNYANSLSLMPLGGADEKEEPYLNSSSFNMFIKYETHLDLVDRRSYEWDTNRGGFVDKSGKILSTLEYEKAKERVVDAFARKAIDLFSDWKGINPPEDSKDDRGLLFRSLANYLAQSD